MQQNKVSSNIQKTLLLEYLEKNLKLPINYFQEVRRMESITEIGKMKMLQH